MVELKEILKQYWGYEAFRPLQEEIIASVLAGKDTLALMPTGGGKSLTFQVPGMVLEGICLVVTPLIALMKDQVEDLQARGIPAEAVYTGMSRERVESVLNKCIYHTVKFLYVSPERLASETFRGKLRQMAVSLIAVDEAHCISQWGYDFRPTYLRVAEVRAYFPGVVVLALTATATPEVVEDIQQQLQFATPHVLSKSFRRENLSYVVRAAEDKVGELLRVLSRMSSSAIVYVRKRKRAEELTAYLVQHGLSADYYHAGLSAWQRDKKQEAWKRGEVMVMVATNAFGMGIDKADVRVVVHYDIPDSLEAYFQEAGRAGRDGQRAYAVLLYNGATLATLKGRVAKEFPEKDYVKRVYEALGNYFQLGEGEGMGHLFEFDVERFATLFKLEPMKVLSSIHILEMGEYMELTTDARAASRVMISVLRDQLYAIDLGDPLQERLLILLMRHYAGIFVQEVFVDEEWVAESLDVDRTVLYHAFIALAKRGVLHYVPGSTIPYILYLQPRLPLSYMQLSRSAYEDRKESYAKKIEAMVRYVDDEVQCRQLYLMAYFGQQERDACGVCDLCLQAKKKVVNKSEVERLLREQLARGDMEIKALVNSIPFDREVVIGQIRLLLDQEIIHYVTPSVLHLTVGS